MIREIKGHKPAIAATAFIAPSADIIGEVTIGADSSVWYQCVLRGDVGPIVIGEKTNVQDGTIIHCTYNRFHVTIGNSVTIGHKAMLHGCSVGDEAFVGMGAILLDGSVMQTRSFLAAGSLLPSGATAESGFLYMGSPAKKMRALREEELQFLGESADNYFNYKKWYEPKA